MSKMPNSPVIDGMRNARPEWREYLAQTEAAVALFRSLLDNTSGVQQLRDRLDAITTRIANIKQLATGGDQLRAALAQNENNGNSRARFTHGLGTPHIFVHAQDPVTQLAAGRLRDVHWDEDQIDFLDDDLATMNNTMYAAIIGVHSDRY